jgi:hypothetical protein
MTYQEWIAEVFRLFQSRLSISLEATEWDFPEIYKEQQTPEEVIEDYMATEW